MDGNNRWSKIKNISKFQSYSKGANNLIRLSKNIFENTEIKYITAFALSANNLKRSKKLIDIILNILELNLDHALNNKINFSISIRGDLRFLNNKIKTKIKLLEKKNLIYKKKLVILMNYSGRQDIVDTFHNINTANKKFTINNFYENSILHDLPDPEILVRTGGFQRISDFLLFNISFTEFFFTKKLWPDLNYSDLKKIIYKYNMIERKFGY